MPRRFSIQMGLTAFYIYLSPSVTLFKSKLYESACLINGQVFLCLYCCHKYSFESIHLYSNGIFEIYKSIFQLSFLIHEISADHLFCLSSLCNCSMSITTFYVNNLLLLKWNFNQGTQNGGSRGVGMGRRWDEDSRGRGHIYTHG